jgi:hypothetical protein
VQTGAILRHRERTTRLLRLLRPVAQAALDGSGGDSHPNAAVADDAIRMCSRRVRTLTEVAGAASRAQRWYFTTDRDVLSAILSARTDAFNTGDVPPDKALAVQLSGEDWYQLVDQLVEQYPDTHTTITTELDAIARQVAREGTSWTSQNDNPY